jgi:hypothetical protein
MKATLDNDAMRERFDADGHAVVRGLFAAEEFKELQAPRARYQDSLKDQLAKRGIAVTI